MVAKIGIMGAGAWGTALAVAITNQEHDIEIWSRNLSVVESINRQNVNNKYLPLIDLDNSVKAVNSLTSFKDKNAILIVTPAQTLRENLELLKKENIHKTIPLVICCKGIERDTSLLMSEVAQEIFPENIIAILSGPNFANEIANQLPAAATLACQDLQLAGELAAMLSSHNFRLYVTDDIIGAQIGGALKNIIAIACGISQGKRLGENSRAALITRGIAEMKRFCLSKGGREDTLMGLSGLGDLVLTCSSLQSRNMSFGYNLGEGKSLKEIVESSNKLVEGFDSTKAIKKLLKDLEIKMPICEEVYNILFENKHVDEALKDLLNRPLTIENI